MRRMIMIFVILMGWLASLNAQQRNASASRVPVQPARFSNGGSGFTGAVTTVSSHDVWQVDAAHSTASLFVGTAANPEQFNIGIARVSGTAVLDRAEPDASRFDLVFYPSGTGGPAGSDGKLANGRNPNAVHYSELIFRSNRTVSAGNHMLLVSGDLTLVRVDRSVTVVLNEAYAGPIYGESVVQTATHPAALLVVVDSDESPSNTPMTISGSFGVMDQSFPGLRSTLTRTNWPIVVEDEQCQVFSNSGEGYFGPVCSGKTVAVIPRTATPTGLGEDYHGFEGAPPTGSQVTVKFELRAVLAAGSLSQDHLLQPIIKQ